MAKIDNRVLLRVSVEISENRQDDILVFERDLEDINGPFALAADFCRKHNLDTTKVLGPLKDHILTNLANLSDAAANRIENNEDVGVDVEGSARVIPPASQQQEGETQKKADHNQTSRTRTLSPPSSTLPKEAPNPKNGGPPPAAPSTPTASAASAHGSLPQKPGLKRADTPAVINGVQSTPTTPAYSSPYAFRKNHPFTPKPRTGPSLAAAGVPKTKNETLKRSTSEKEGSTLRQGGMIKSATTPRVNGPPSARNIHASSVEAHKKAGINGTSSSKVIRSSSTPRVTGHMPTTNNGSSTARSIGSARGKVHANAERLKSVYTSVASDAPVAPNMKQQRENGGNVEQAAELDDNGAEKRTNQEGGGAPRSDVFQKLYKDAVVKNIKMDTLRAKIASAERRRASSHGKLPGCQSARGTPRWGGEEPLGHRLYFDAERKKRKFELLREKQKGIIARKEMEELTLRPEITESQKVISGLPSRVTHMRKLSDNRINAIRKERDQRETEECTFKPSIDTRSQVMMEQRMNRLQIKGTLHDHLYEDAKRREGRYAEYARQEPEETTFHPDIGEERYKSPNDDNRQDFLNRLAYSKTYREKSSNLSTDHDFRPKTGRPPSAPRNKERLPIGLFLYEKGIESMNEKRRVRDEATAVETDKKSMGSTSKEKFNDAKKRKFESIFLKLSKGQETIMSASLAKDMKNAGFEPEVTKFLEPVVAHAIKWKFDMDFLQFEVAMNYMIGKRKGTEPLAHLFTDRKKKEVPVIPTFTPRLAKKTEELAKNRPRDRSLPLYEQLCAESENYEKTRQQRVHERAEELLKECTFQPNNDRMETSRSDPGLRRKGDKLNVQPDPALTSITANRDVFVEVAERKILEKRNNQEKVGFQQQVDLAEGAIRRCKDVVTKAKSTVIASLA